MSFVMYHQYGKSPCTTVVDHGLVCPPHGGRPFTLALAEAFKISDGSIHEMEAVFTVYSAVRRRGAW